MIKALTPLSSTQPQIIAGHVVTQFDGMLKAALDSQDIMPGEQEIDHYQTSDLLGRRCRIPAGTLGTTYVHKFDHLAICLTGSLILVDQDGNRTYVEAPEVIVTKAGTHRAVLALTDVDWVTVHHTEHQDLSTIEETLGCRTMLEYMKELEPCLSLEH